MISSLQGILGALAATFVAALTLPVGADVLPSKVLDLSCWKITLPSDVKKPLGIADEVKQPALDTFFDRKYFYGAEKGVVFRAPCGGATTKNSKYPRCELREMSKDGKSRAAWKTGAPLLRSMDMLVSIMQLPRVKRHVVCAQIHGGNDDLMMIRLEGKKLIVERNKIGDVVLDEHYQLGSPFRVKIQAGGGRVKVWYQGVLKMNWEVDHAGCYFKAGCYTQSNPDKGDRPEDYGEVIIHQLVLSNQG